ncbi:MAG: SDR family oxidoreductase [Anaerolineales bacterium]
MKRLLVTGATGYIGGRLTPALVDEGYHVRAMTRDRSRLSGREWLDQVEVVEGDALEPESLSSALDDIDAAYYLIHSMSGSDEFQQRDIQAARTFGQAAAEAGVQRIIYLGGLGDPESNLSEHLRSRQETGKALGEAGVPVTEFRAGIVVGAGSLSFEMIRSLAELIPVMIAPSWVRTRIQPIAIRDVIKYLTRALEVPQSKGKIFEVGGQDVLTYGDMLLQYADIRGLKRFIIPVPVLTPRLSSYWVHWMTPIPSQIARPLIEGLRNEVIVRHDTASELFPDIQPMGYRKAVERALDQLTAGEVATAWSDSLSSTGRGKKPVVLETREGMIVEQRQRIVNASPASVYQVFSQLGGDRGWLFANFLWRLRGVLDRIFGGVGFRRGRRSATDLRVGDAVDFWRVEALEPDRMVRYRAEMKVPGRAWLEFRVEQLDQESSRLVQTSYFAPKGLLGFLYWYLLYPFHGLIFLGLVNKVAAVAEDD